MVLQYRHIGKSAGGLESLEDSLPAGKTSLSAGSVGTQAKVIDGALEPYVIGLLYNLSILMSGEGGPGETAAKSVLEGLEGRGISVGDGANGVGSDSKGRMAPALDALDQLKAQLQAVLSHADNGDVTDVAKKAVADMVEKISAVSDEGQRDGIYVKNTTEEKDGEPGEGNNGEAEGSVQKTSTLLIAQDDMNTSENRGHDLSRQPPSPLDEEQEKVEMRIASVAAFCRQLLQKNVSDQGNAASGTRKNARKSKSRKSVATATSGRGSGTTPRKSARSSTATRASAAMTKPAKPASIFENEYFGIQDLDEATVK